MDLVIVIGTSLKVAPVAEVPGVLPPHIPQIYISRTVGTQTDGIESQGLISIYSLYHTRILISIYLATAMWWCLSFAVELGGTWTMR